jgi:hypothetical protein
MLNLSWIASGPKEEYEEKNRVSSFKGYLFKMRRSQNVLAPQWGKRWFSIEGRFLKWYRQESDLNSSGMVDLKYTRNITKLDCGGLCTFVVICQDRNIILRANALLEMNNWIRALHIQADIARGGSGMCIVSDFNELPLRSKGMVKSRKNANNKLRSSLSLEQELDLNLTRLNALEQELLLKAQEVATKNAATKKNLSTTTTTTTVTTKNTTTTSVDKKNNNRFVSNNDTKNEEKYYDEDDDEFSIGYNSATYIRSKHETPVVSQQIKTPVSTSNSKYSTSTTTTTTASSENNANQSSNRKKELDIEIENIPLEVRQPSKRSIGKNALKASSTQLTSNYTNSTVFRSNNNQKDSSNFYDNVKG